MMQRMMTAIVVLCCGFGAGMAAASAAVIVVSLPEFSGDFHDDEESYPLAPSLIGTFTYDIPQGHSIDSGALTSKFGNSQGGNTAPLDVLFNDLLVAQCTTGGSCSEIPQEAISFNFSKVQFQYLAQQSVDLRAVQTGPGTTRLGSWDLTITTRPIPEPATALLLGLGFLGLLAPLRRPRP